MRTKRAASTAKRKPNRAGGGEDRSGTARARPNLGPSDGIELQEAIHRYVELYDFAPIPYVSFDRTGRIEEINLAAVQLLGRSRKALIGCPFSLHVVADDAALFHRHLQRCHSAEPRVETELRLKNAQQQITHAYLSSTPINATMRDGALLFQTAIVDLTERIRAQEKLRESEERFRALVSQSAAGICRADLDGKLTFVNQKTCEMLGYTESELVGKTIRELTWPEDLKDRRELFEQVRAEGKPFEIEKRLVRKDNSVIWVNISASPIWDMTGELRSTVAVILNITERKRAERALQVSREYLAAALSTARMTAWEWDPKTDQVAASENVSEVFGLRSDQKFDSSAFVLSLVHPDDARRHRKLVQRAGERGQSWHTEFRVLRPRDCKIVWLEERATAIREPITGKVRITGLVWDVTERKQAEEKLRQSQERFRLLVEGAKEYAMFLLDGNNCITFWSGGAERIFGWTAKDAVGKKGDLVFTPEDRATGQVEKEIEIAKRDGQAPDRRWHLRKDGSRVWIDGVMQRLDDEQTGTIRAFAKIARDATEQRQAEDGLRHARDQLEQRVLERTADLMATNNELERTIAQREQLERELLEISERERRRIGQDLHDVICQELTATALFLKSTGNKINNRQAAKTLSEAAEIVNRNVAIARDLARGFQPVLAGAVGLIDALRGLCKQANEVPHIHCILKLRRAIRIRDETIALNLFRVAQEAVRNAVTHSGATEIVICIERERDLVRLVVEDNGKGFTVPKRSRGLGLHIMRYRASALGGRLKIDSRRKGGTRVVCDVPIKK